MLQRGEALQQTPYPSLSWVIQYGMNRRIDVASHAIHPSARMAARSSLVIASLIASPTAALPTSLPKVGLPTSTAAINTTASYGAVANCDPQDFLCLKATPQQTAGWTYNDVVSGGSHQQLFCKMQSADTFSRSTTNGPKLLSTNLVAAGVGLSNLQFGQSSQFVEGQIACGMCVKAILKPSSAAKFTDMNCENTVFASTASSELTFMVVDQCKDDVCVNGGSWLDIEGC